MAVDDATDTVFTANPQNSGTVSLINGTTNKATATVDVGSFPTAVAVYETTDTDYVTNYGLGHGVCVQPDVRYLPGALPRSQPQPETTRPAWHSAHRPTTVGWRSGRTPSRPPT